MEIHLVTLIAQVLNFLILIWILKRFLYSRIVQVMRDREKRLQDQQIETKQIRLEAEREAQAFREKNRLFEEKREHLLAEARKDSERKRQEWIEEARREIAEKKAQWQSALMAERESLLQDLRRHAGVRIVEVLRRLLNDLANVDFEHQMLTVFLNRIENLEPLERQGFLATLQNPTPRVWFRTSFVLGVVRQEQVLQVLRAVFLETLSVEFETTEEVAIGVELRSRSHRLVWTLESYLAVLESDLLQSLEKNDQNHRNGPKEALSAGVVEKLTG